MSPTYTLSSHSPYKPIHNLHATHMNPIQEPLPMLYRLVKGLFIRKESNSNIWIYYIKEHVVGNCMVTNLHEFFHRIARVTFASILVTGFEQPIHILCLFDKLMHNHESDCPYLFLIIHNNYQLRDFTLDDVQPTVEAWSKFVTVINEFRSLNQIVSHQIIDHFFLPIKSTNCLSLHIQH